jgi:hypothetical protein
MCFAFSSRLTFSNWYAWHNRNKFLSIDCPGVYLIAITNRRDLEGTVPVWKDVDYIGMTNSRGGLRSRWNQFDRAIRGGSKHSGARSAVSRLGLYSKWKKNLYVAGMVIPCNVEKPSPKDLIKMGQVAFLEYKAMAAYSISTKRLHPKYNKR